MQHWDLDNEHPLEGILLSTMFAIRSMVHITTRHKLSQLVFGRDTTGKPTGNQLNDINRR